MENKTRFGIGKILFLVSASAFVLSIAMSVSMFIYNLCQQIVYIDGYPMTFCDWNIYGPLLFISTWAVPVSFACLLIGSLFCYCLSKNFRYGLISISISLVLWIIWKVLLYFAPTFTSNGFAYSVYQIIFNLAIIFAFYFVIEGIASYFGRIGDYKRQRIGRNVSYYFVIGIGCESVVSIIEKLIKNTQSIEVSRLLTGLALACELFAFGCFLYYTIRSLKKDF